MTLQRLIDGRRPFSEIFSVEQAGIYGIFARRSDSLPGISLPDSRAIYVGQTSNLAQRNHFMAKSSGFHSPRRSLEAILKSLLYLRAVPRAPGPSPSNYQSFAFTAEGEAGLTEWMQEHLDYSIIDADGGLSELERQSTQALEPPLNLTLWKNPQKRHIQDLRQVQR